MTGALWILAVTVVTGALLYLIHRLTAKPGDDTATQPAPTEGQCCGQHAICERDSLLLAVNKETVYFDDEELDQYRGTAADAYDEQQVEQFRDVLYTLRRDDLAPWARSIRQRGITLPEPIHDELLMLIAEARQAKTGK